MKRVLISCILIMLTMSMAAASDKRALTLEDLYRVRYPGALTISQDGREALFTLSTSDLRKGTSDTNIWRMNLINQSVQQLTFHEKADYSPHYSKDGKWIYFISNRNEGPQLWRMATGGGEPRQLTHFETGISSPVLLPDGRHILFSSFVFPECGADSDCNRKYQKRLDNGPAQGHYATSLLYRHWNHYRDWTYSHIFELDMETGEIRALTDGKTDFPCYGGSMVLSPDGTQLCVTVNNDTNKAESTNTDLLLINLKSGRKTDLTSANPAYDGDPQFSPDGRYLAYRYQKIPGYESDRFRLAVYDLKEKRTTFLTESFDNWIQEVHWGPDSKTIYFTAPEKGYTPLYRISMTDGALKKQLDGHVLHSFRVTSDNRVVFIRSSVGEPHEIWSFMPEKERKASQISSFNAPVAEEVDIRPAEIMWFEGADGRQIQTFVVKPHDFDSAKTYPLIINVHGGPQMMWADSFRGDWQVYPGSGYVVAFPNPHGSTGYGQEFTAAISRDYDGRVMTDVLAVTEGLAALPYVDKERMGAMGWSWGGYAMMWLEGQQQSFKALVAMMGIFDLKSMYYATEELWFPDWDNGGTPWENDAYYQRATPSNYVENFKTPCLVITGERDYRVPYTQSLQFFTALQKMNVPSELIVFSNDGHWPDTVKSMPIYYNAHLEWFHKYLGGDAAPFVTEDMLRNIAFEPID